jgi:hypothetical protein
MALAARGVQQGPFQPQFGQGFAMVTKLVCTGDLVDLVVC